MKTSTPDSTSRRQPLRQTRTNPPRTSASRGFATTGPTDIFPAILGFTDTITALPKDVVRHFTLLKEVDAKVFAPEEALLQLVESGLKAPTAPEVYGMENMRRRQVFRQCAFTMQEMLVSLDEKNHVISTATEALNKQLARMDDCFPHLEEEISDEARNGSASHWAYPENRVARPDPRSRRELAAVNTLSQAAQLVVDDAAARSDARKQAMLAKRRHVESDFDDAVKTDMSKKLHGNSKARKAADAAAGVAINPPKRRKVERVERPAFVVAPKASPRETPVPEVKKRSRANGQRKRTNTITSKPPSVASSPVVSTFPEIKKPILPEPVVRPTSTRARQNSTQSIVGRPTSSASNKPPVVVIPEPEIVKETQPEVVAEEKEEVQQPEPEKKVDRKGSLKREETEVEIPTVTTKSGRASKPSTPALSNFPEPVRSRSSRNVDNVPPKRSHKKGASQATIQIDADDDVDADEPTYCYCNGVSYGEMVGCDADGCTREWFHLECVGLKTAPKGNAKWYCEDCKEKMKNKRFSVR